MKIFTTHHVIEFNLNFSINLCNNFCYNKNLLWGSSLVSQSLKKFFQMEYFKSLRGFCQFLCKTIH